MTPCFSLADSSLYRAAFGDRPGDVPIFAPSGSAQTWLYAVALGGQGRYAAAHAALDEVLRVVNRGPVASLASSTRASLLRQTGWHRQASGLDGHALAVRAPDRRALESAAPVELVWGAAARCDAMTGLAADALGCGRLALGWRLLDRCSNDLAAYDEFADAGQLWRQHLRLGWVSAELALAGGDFATAGRHARGACAIAGRSPSVRHRVKSDLLRAATMTGGPDVGPAKELAEDVFDRAQRHGLMPLKWAATMLLAGVTSDSSWEVERDACELLIGRRGGRFNT